MNEIILAIILGIVQGLTEFLPVSSSGHLELAKYFLGDTSVAQESLLMTVVLHAATALATVVVFRRDIWWLLRGLLQGTYNEETAFCLKIVLSMVPAALVGLFFEDALDALFNQQVVWVSLMLVVTAALLWLADRATHTDKTVGYREAFLVGIAQAIAIMPGISRSGATISAAVLLGIDRDRAARFSFLMVVPLILGKMAKDLLDGDLSQTTQPTALAAGFVAAFVTGVVACIWMIKLVKNGKLTYFAIYCLLVAALALAAVWW